MLKTLLRKTRQLLGGQADSLSPKQLLDLDLTDPYGEGVEVDRDVAELLGVFEEEALDLYDFDQSFPAAMRELLGPLEG
ncbi:MAG: hypothetical protein LBS60_02195 [Deltaproteobacteria bacterium]|nr:hypothetical protein [Deltaproteobacteria bacterium]